MPHFAPFTPPLVIKQITSNNLQAAAIVLPFSLPPILPQQITKYPTGLKEACRPQLHESLLIQTVFLDRREKKNVSLF